MKQIIRWTIGQKRWAIFWWCAGLVFYVFLTLIFYPTLHHQAAQLNKSFGDIPQTAKQLFTDTGNLFSPIGYLSSQLFYLMLPLLVGILAINQGMGLIGKEERDNTIELLLARPLSRGRLLLGKSLAGLAIVLVAGGLTTLFTALMCRLVGLDVGSKGILEAGAAVILMSLAFGAVAFMLTALGRAGRSASIGITALFALGGYILVSLAPTITWLRWPAKIFPFNYYHSAELLAGGYNWLNGIYFGALIAGCMAVAWLAFRRRDLANS